MANYTTADIKTLREKTAAGMLDVKKALDEADGDMAKAEDILRVKGLKGVTKREGRTASNGLVTAVAGDGVGTLVEVLCETDFVAKGERFGALAHQVLDQAVATEAADAEALLSSTLGDGKTVQELVDEANATIGEKIEIKRVARVVAPTVVAYLHKTSPDLPAQIGVLFGSEGGDEILGAVDAEAGIVQRRAAQWQAGACDLRFRVECRVGGKKHERVRVRAIDAHFGEHVE